MAKTDDAAHDARYARTRCIAGDVVAGIDIDGEYDVVIDGHCLHCIIGDDHLWAVARKSVA